jgi:hypothetical protein
MYASTAVYSGLVLVLIGLTNIVRPIGRLRIRTRRRGVAVAGSGMLVTCAGLLAPAFESRAEGIRTHLDEFVPVWQFDEWHTIRIAAPPARVFDAIKAVRADEIALFRTLTWIRRGGRRLPPGILNAGLDKPLIDVATNAEFVRLAEDAPREIVIGTVVVAPRGTHRSLTPSVFRTPLPPGFVLGALNFIVAADGGNGSTVSTETRVFANSRGAHRRFAMYWRLIYPGSAIIRRMWLRAIARRAEDGPAQ